MGNSFNVSTLVWVVDSTGTLTATTGANALTNPVVRKVILVPNAADDTVTFYDGDSQTAIYLKAGASDASPIHVDFGDDGKRVPGLTCYSGSTGIVAYVYLK